MTHWIVTTFTTQPLAGAGVEPRTVIAPARALPARMPELDGLRAIAIMMVLVWHYFSTQVAAEPGTPLAAAIGLAKASWSGVDLFFVLSGFLIGGILLDNRTSPNIIRNFYIRRACRILPLYLVTLAAFFLARSLSGEPDAWLYRGSLPDWSYLTFTQNFFMARESQFGAHWLDVTWSLALEEQFYLFVPVVLVFLPLRVGLAILVSLIVLAPLLRAQVGGIGAYVLPFCRADALLIGVLCAVAVRQRLWSVLNGTFTTALIVAAGLFFVGIPLLIKAGLMEMGGSFVHSYFAVFYAVLLLGVLRSLGSTLTSPLRWPSARWMGERSFAIYLLHQPVSGMLHGSLAGGAPAIADLGGACITIASLIVTLILAEVSFRLVEKPAMDYGRRFAYSGSGRR